MLTWVADWLEIRAGQSALEICESSLWHVGPSLSLRVALDQLKYIEMMLVTFVSFHHIYIYIYL